jgi:hypothetical protein
MRASRVPYLTSDGSRGSVSSPAEKDSQGRTMSKVLSLRVLRLN